MIKNPIDYVYSKSIYSEVKGIINSLPHYAVIKGKPLSKIIYNDLQERISTDLDLLCPKEELYYVVSKLEKIGFSSKNKDKNDLLFCKLFSHQYLPLTKVNNYARLTIDVNFDLFWGEFQGKRIDIESFLSDTIEMNIYGTMVKTLPPIKALIQLILHDYKDMNSIFLLATRNSINYTLFKDIYHLIINNTDTIKLNELYDICLKYEIIPYVFYVLYYTGEIFDDKLIKEYIDAFSTPEGIALLNKYGLNSDETREWRYDFQTRLKSNNLYELIKDELTEKDIKKIHINKHIFGGYSQLE